MEYLDFAVAVDNHNDGEYLIAARSAAGEPRTTTGFPLTVAALESHLIKLENAILRSVGRRRRIPSAEEQAVQDFGRALFGFLLQGEVLSSFRACQQRAHDAGKGVRIKLTVTPPALAALPWEFLYDPAHHDYLCLDPNTPLVRYPTLPLALQPLPVTPPLRILGVCVETPDLPTLDVAAERARMVQAVAPLRDRGLIELTWLEGQTADDLQRAMRHGPWHICHFIGHGSFDTLRDEGLILLTDEAGAVAPLYATQLARLLARQRHALRLVLLNACEGARGGRHDLFSSTAATLVGSGIPAVLAMQYEITDAAALQFARTFYEALADNLPVDTAVADARNAMTLRNHHSLEWGTPVLYLRAPDGRLFDVGEGGMTTNGGSTNARAEAENTAQMATPEEIPGETPGATVAGQLDPLTFMRDVLAGLYPSEGDARRLVDDAGINPARITFSGHATNNWHAILQEAAKNDQIGALLAVARREYGNNQALQMVAAFYGGSPAGGTTRHATVTPQPITPLPIDFAWVPIPAGPFFMGSDKAKDNLATDDETPQHTLDLPDYRIARYPVTVAQFRQFVEATKYRTTAEEQGSAYVWTGSTWDDVKGAYWAKPRGPDSNVNEKANHPVTCVSWDDANAFCHWATEVLQAAGQEITVRLPTEAEWEKAARGTDGQIYPWGNQPPTEERCNFNMNVKDTTPVGSYPDGASPYGVMEMAGNVWEWTSSRWGQDAQNPDFGYPYNPKDGREDPAAAGRRVVRGGSFGYYDYIVRCAYRNLSDPVYRDFYLGFRVLSPGS